MAQHYYTYTGTSLKGESIFEIYQHRSGTDTDVRLGDVTSASYALQLCTFVNKGAFIADKLTYLGPGGIEALTRKELEGGLPLMCAIDAHLNVTPLYESDFM